MILCVGALGSGKSTLLRILQQHGQDLESETIGEVTVPKPVVTPLTTPTMGTDLLTVAHRSLVREVGGAMAPIWSSCKHLK